jgi:hypothetical protein
MPALHVTAPRQATANSSRFSGSRSRRPPPAARRRATGPVHGLRQHGDPGCADGEQDKHEQVRGAGRQGSVVDEEAPDKRAERRACGDAHRVGERGEPAVAVRLEVHQRRTRGAVDNAGEDSLQGAAGQEHRQVHREHHDHHRGRHAKQRGDEGRTAAEPVRQRAEGQQRRQRAKGIAGERH